MKHPLSSAFLSPVLSLVLTLGLALPALAGEITVSAAASLTESINEIKALFEKANPGVTVVANYAASGPLLKQIQQGAPVDVFISANQKFMNVAAKENLMAEGTRIDVVANDLVIAVPAGNPAKVTDLASLKQGAAKRIGLGNPDSVPAGQYAKAALAKAGLWESLSPSFIFGESVRQVLDYVRRGEVDAAFVYATDAIQAGSAVAVASAVPLDEDVSYPAAVLAAAPHAKEAKAFVAFLISPQAQAVFKAKGFRIP